MAYFSKLCQLWVLSYHCSLLTVILKLSPLAGTSISCRTITHGGWLLLSQQNKTKQDDSSLRHYTTNMLFIYLTCALRAHSNHSLHSLLPLDNKALHCAPNLMASQVNSIRILTLQNVIKNSFRTYFLEPPWPTFHSVILSTDFFTVSFNLLHWQIILNSELKFKFASDRFTHDENVMVFITSLIITSFHGHCLNQVEEWLQFSF